MRSQILCGKCDFSRKNMKISRKIGENIHQSTQLIETSRMVVFSTSVLKSFMRKLRKNIFLGVSLFCPPPVVKCSFNCENICLIIIIHVTGQNKFYFRFIVFLILCVIVLNLLRFMTRVHVQVSNVLFSLLIWKSCKKTKLFKYHNETWRTTGQPARRSVGRPPGRPCARNASILINDNSRL